MTGGHLPIDRLKALTGIGQDWDYCPRLVCDDPDTVVFKPLSPAALVPPLLFSVPLLSGRVVKAIVFEPSVEQAAQRLLNDDAIWASNGAHFDGIAPLSMLQTIKAQYH